MSPVRSVLDDWGVKLLALLLAWGLWFAVREDIDDVREAVLPLAAEEPPGGAVAGELQEKAVKVRVRGRRADLDYLLNGSMALTVPIRADDLAADQFTGTRRLAADELRFPERLPPGSVRILEMEPGVVTVRLRRMSREEKRIRPPELPGVGELNVQVERRRWPDKVIVRGPADELARALSLDTQVDREALRRAVESMGDAARLTHTLPMTIVGADVEVIEPRPLEVTVDLVRDASKTLHVPLAVFHAAGAGRRAVRILPGPDWLVAGDAPQVVLELRGNPKALAALTPDDVGAFVVASDLPPGAERGELRVQTRDLPSGVVRVQEQLLVPVEVVR